MLYIPSRSSWRENDHCLVQIHSIPSDIHPTIVIRKSTWSSLCTGSCLHKVCTWALTNHNGYWTITHQCKFSFHGQQSISFRDLLYPLPLTRTQRFIHVRSDLIDAKFLTLLWLMFAADMGVIVSFVMLVTPCTNTCTSRKIFKEMSQQMQFRRERTRVLYLTWSSLWVGTNNNKNSIFAC